MDFVLNFTVFVFCFRLVFEEGGCFLEEVDYFLEARLDVRGGVSIFYFFAKLLDFFIDC